MQRGPCPGLRLRSSPSGLTFREEDSESRRPRVRPQSQSRVARYRAPSLGRARPDPDAERSRVRRNGHAPPLASIRPAGIASIADRSGKIITSCRTSRPSAASDSAGCRPADVRGASPDRARIGDVRSGSTISSSQSLDADQVAQGGEIKEGVGHDDRQEIPVVDPDRAEVEAEERDDDDVWQRDGMQEAEEHARQDEAPGAGPTSG